jgi:hypothetical protein
MPGAETYVEVIPHPLYYKGKPTEVLLTAEAPEAQLTVVKLARLDVRFAESVDVVAPGRTLRMAIQSQSPLPTYLKRGSTVVGKRSQCRCCMTFKLKWGQMKGWRSA